MTAEGGPRREEDVDVVILLSVSFVSLWRYPIDRLFKGLSPS